MYDYNSITLLLFSYFLHYPITVSDFGQSAEIKTAKKLSKTVAVQFCAGGITPSFEKNCTFI
jgi:hypothetical protein